MTRPWKSAISPWKMDILIVKLISLTFVVRVAAVLLVGILDERDVGQRDLAHVLHQVEPPALGPAK